MEATAITAMTDLKKIYSMMMDEESKYVYINRLNYLVTGNYHYMANIVEKYLPNLTVMKGGGISSLLKELPEEKKIIVYGAGANAKKTIKFWRNDARFIGFCDRDEQKQLEGLDGFPVIAPTVLFDKYRNETIVISVDHSESEIRKSMIEAGIPEEHIFDMEPYVFRGDDALYFGVNFISYEDSEIFVDAGCKNLGSTMGLLRKCKRLEKVYAFEPDPSNYQDCLRRKEKEGLSQVNIYPYGTWNKSERLAFAANGDGTSCISNNGKTSIDAVAIDEIVDESDRVTFIKMDVEGAELKSLEGAKHTIQKNRPKLAICIYHKPEDMITLPLYIKSLVPEYQLYMRHHGNATNETVLYAICHSYEQEGM